MRLDPKMFNIRRRGKGHNSMQAKSSEDPVRKTRNRLLGAGRPSTLRASGALNCERLKAT